MIQALYSARERAFPSDSVNAFVLTRGTYVFLTPLIVSEVAVGVRGVVVLIGFIVFDSALLDHILYFLSNTSCGRLSNDGVHIHPY